MENEPKFTKGPWKREDNVEAGGISHFAIVSQNANRESEDWLICSVTPMRFKRQSDIANANLIAAAPELYASLKLCLEIVRIQNGNLHEDINAIQLTAKNALAKAEGR